MPMDTSLDEVAAGIDRVAGKAQEWAALPAAEKRDLFAQCLQNLQAEADNLVAAACASRGYEEANLQHGHLVADAGKLSLACVAGWIRGAIELMDSLARTGNPPQASNIESRPDGSTRLTVFPTKFMDTIVGDVGCCLACPVGKGGSFDIIVRGPAKQFNPLDLPASVTGVLGAGNTDIPNDIIDPMCKENSVVVYKSNPVMARGAEVKRRIFKPLIDHGYLAMFHGGIEQGKMIVDSPKVEKLACTGSVMTYDRIVWGSQDKTDPAVQPLVTKPFLAELGSVNPYIVVPGNWSEKEIEYQAHTLISYKMVNNGHICASPQVILTCKQWPQRQAFIDAVRRQVKECQAYRLFYPGVRKGYEEHKADLGGGSDVTVQEVSLGFGEAESPLLFRAGVSPEACIESGMPLAWQNEAFCPILTEVPLDTEATFDTFLPAAVDFAHNRLWGSLTCSIIVDDTTKASNQVALDAILDGMRFGTVGVNVPPSIANAFPVLGWGGFPGHTSRDVQSGIGYIGNICCYENLEKTVMQGRFQNLLQFCNEGTPEFQLKKYRRQCDVLLHMSWWSIAKFASATFTGI